ncbi:MULTISPECIES: amidase domain-containing protein [unclassified Oceanobacillus]|uniref:amidase domain-containing protein n=1 Tax=unclassified Oceanobacillus TaxID=2630292 RepID=UPI001BE7E52D|nr:MULTISPECIES: amidase domain-containing protein [unclassified Oceanobacillus]MBT2599203.1 amidase domain-containing protein [Oceanobacillus sp. ISL-74]MBT2652121.1 amidase domain-containing protein [Oceanobacillus sp. ISL-73]
MKSIKEYWSTLFSERHSDDEWWQKKLDLLEKRNATIVKITGDGKVTRKLHYDDRSNYEYVMHLQFLIKQNERFMLEEQVLPFSYSLLDKTIVNHHKRDIAVKKIPDDYSLWNSSNKSQRIDTSRFEYNRLEAVKYAERWWNSYNPAYRTFEVDCTNYISQCLYAGGAPTWGEPVRERGWWYSGNSWSFSWSVAHSMRWYLSGSQKGLKGKEVESPEELFPGDVICYDFEGDNRWNHTTIVVTKDEYGMPLVNAHTDNSRHRYWSYEDSTAYTPDIQYKFFRIGEN